MPARHKFTARRGPHPHLDPLLHLRMFRRINCPAGKRRPEKIPARRRVRNKRLPPAVKRDPPRIRKPITDERVEPPRERLEPIHPRVVIAHRPVRRLDLRVKKRALLKIQIPARPQRERADRMMRIRRVKPVQHPLAHVRAIIPIRVLQEQQVRLRRHQHATLEKFQPRRHMQPARENRRLVRAPVAVRVLQNHDLVIRPRAPRRVAVPQRLILRIARHRHHPQPPARVERHLHRVRDFRKLLLRRETIHRVTRRELEALHRRRAREIFELARLRALARQALRRHALGRFLVHAVRAEERRHRQRRGHVRIVDLHRHRLAPRRPPHARVAIRHHRIEHLPLPLHHVRVRLLTIRELQLRAPAINVESIHRAIPEKPLPILLVHLPAQLLREFPRPPTRAEQSLIQNPRHELLPRRVEMHPVDRELRRAPRAKSVQRRREQIHKPRAPRRRHLRQRRRVQFQIRVVRRAIGKIRITQILVRNRRHQHHLRRALAAVILLRRVREKTLHVRLEFRHARRPRKRFIEPKKRQHHRRLAVREMRVRRSEIPRAWPRPQHAIARRIRRLRDRQFRLHVHLIRRPREIPHHQPLLREALMQQRFPMPVMLHPLRQRVADETNVIFRLQLQPRRARRRMSHRAQRHHHRRKNQR